MRVLVLSLCLVAALAAPIDEWEAFKASFGKGYMSTQDEEYRKSVFYDTLKEITEHNKEADQGVYTYWKGVNQFSDMTDKEFRETMLIKPHTSDLTEDTPLDDTPIPSAIDWRSRGSVTGVRNQGSCGSCWAFGAVAAIESGHHIKTGRTEDLSEQQLVDCDNGNSGCQGGFTHKAFDYVRSCGGIVKESNYRYTARDGWCNFNRNQIAVKITGKRRLRGDSSLCQGLGGRPVSAAVDAGPWKNYRGGIYNGRCTTRLNHETLAVGFNAQAFIIKNSWGRSFGEDGYIRLARGGGKNTCGVHSDNAYPTM